MTEKKTPKRKRVKRTVTSNADISIVNPVNSFPSGDNLPVKTKKTKTDKVTEVPSFNDIDSLVKAVIDLFDKKIPVTQKTIDLVRSILEIVVKVVPLKPDDRKISQTIIKAAYQLYLLNQK